MDVIYFKELEWRLRKTMPVFLAVHHKSAITTPSLRESSYYKEEPLFLWPDPIHEVEAGKKGALNCREWGAAGTELSHSRPGREAFSTS